MTTRRDPSEHAIQNRELVDLSSMDDAMFWRNNTGSAWRGKDVTPPIGRTITLTIRPGTLVLEEARIIRFGLPGSGDILGTVDGHAVAVEVKDAHGKQQESQLLFQRAWEKAGGIYILSRCPGSAREQLQQKIDSER